MSREFNIHPQDMAAMKVWHLQAMHQYLDRLSKG